MIGETLHEPYMEACGNAVIARGVEINGLQTTNDPIRAGVLHLGDPNEAPGDRLFYWDEERGWAYSRCVPGESPFDVVDKMTWFGDRVLPTPEQLAELVATLLGGAKLMTSFIGPDFRRAGDDDGLETYLAHYATALEVA
ncbi:hypothetical protein SAMN05421874_12894 [Nonomuraea maritima]|uniref:DUF6292 domain-containing protein n=1 Tax=Nonomuraea maritima TaxID=683260 RepID=A0A1G9MNG9_9ACTN|nr:DUF6292 family protein [Nonomuraea maritima]SDL75205.1 hypothetical protein SAMN05421874_12894 [Nonomuraea maritima]